MKPRIVYHGHMHPKAWVRLKPRTDWRLVVTLVASIALTLATLAYKWGSP